MARELHGVLAATWLSGAMPHTCWGTTSSFSGREGIYSDKFTVACGIALLVIEERRREFGHGLVIASVTSEKAVESLHHYFNSWVSWDLEKFRHKTFVLIYTGKFCKLWWGHVLAPKLCTTYINYIIGWAVTQSQCRRILAKIKVTDHDFAEDITILTETER